MAPCSAQPIRVLIVGVHSVAARAVELALCQEGLQIDVIGGTAQQVLKGLQQDRPQVVIMERPTPRGFDLEVDQVLEAIPECLVVLLDNCQGVARFCFGSSTPLNNEKGIRRALKVRQEVWPTLSAQWKGEQGDEAGSVPE